MTYKEIMGYKDTRRDKKYNTNIQRKTTNITYKYTKKDNKYRNQNVIKDLKTEKKKKRKTGKNEDLENKKRNCM